ncbi:MAG: hypothetical protein OQJ84_07310 [Xanthomonadales bacterium]|nr:hypothetical protein [Xanthomonadales bacterium]
MSKHVFAIPADHPGTTGKAWLVYLYSTVARDELKGREPGLGEQQYVY